MYGHNRKSIFITFSVYISKLIYYRIISHIYSFLAKSNNNNKIKVKFKYNKWITPPLWTYNYSRCFSSSRVYKHRTYRTNSWRLTRILSKRQETSKRCNNLKHYLRPLLLCQKCRLLVFQNKTSSCFMRSPKLLICNWIITFHNISQHFKIPQHNKQ